MHITEEFQARAFTKDGKVKSDYVDLSAVWAGVYTKQGFLPGLYNILLEQVSTAIFDSQEEKGYLLNNLQCLPVPEIFRVFVQNVRVVVATNWDEIINHMQKNPGVEKTSIYRQALARQKKAAAATFVFRETKAPLHLRRSMDNLKFDMKHFSEIHVEIGSAVQYEFVGGKINKGIDNLGNLGI